MKRIITIILAIIMIVLASFTNSRAQVPTTVDTIEEAWMAADPSFFEGFTVSVLGGIRATNTKINTDSRQNMTGMKVGLQAQGVSIKEYSGYTFGLQFAFVTQNYFQPLTQTQSLINIGIRNYEFNTFFGFCDEKHNMIGFLVGGGKADTKKYGGYWNFGIIGSMMLPIMPTLYLGLQPEIGIKNNQLLRKGSDLYVTILINITKRL